MTTSRVSCTVEDVEAAVEAASAVLSRFDDGDWERPAGDVAPSCRRVLVHIADDLVAYAAQLVTGATDAYVPLSVSIDESAGTAGIVEALRAAAGMFTATLRAAPDGARGWHPWGMADADAVAAMGIVELLVHTHDICAAVDVEWQGPAGPSAAALRRIFPDIAHLLDNHGPWDVLLWATGRLALPGHPRRTEWRWHNELD